MAMVANDNKKEAGDALMDAIFDLRRCCDQKESDIQSDLGLSPAQYACLRAFPGGIAGQIAAGDLCRRMELSASRGGRIIEQLVQMELLVRHPDPEDRRVHHLVLSAEGERVKSEIVSCLQRCDAEIRRRLNDAEVRLAGQGIKLLLKAFIEGDHRVEQLP